jgi:5-methylcytosine-specific restriction endonuclease McrA
LREWRAKNPEKQAAICKTYDEKNRDKRSAYAKQYRKDNPEKVQEQVKAWVKANPEKIKGYMKKASKAWHERNPDYQSNFYKANKERYIAASARRRASQDSATPSWLTAIDKAMIQEMYDVSEARYIQTGIKHHVDHIVPINGKGVAGMHVPWNLQVITAHENLSKGWRF